MNGRSRSLLGGDDAVAALAELRGLQVNYDPAEVGEPSWTFDTHIADIGAEHPGPPEPGGLWERAHRVIEDYEFTPPELIRAIYHAHDPLLGRNILLEGRFFVLRFHLPVRVTEVIDTGTDAERRWGWSYETLGAHLERGKVRYEIVKNLRSGRVQFVSTVYSQHSPELGPVLRLGWALFGRRTQLRFYRRIGENLRDLATSAAPPKPRTRRGDLVLVPAGAEPSALDRFLSVRRRHPAGKAGGRTD